MADANQPLDIHIGLKDEKALRQAARLVSNMEKSARKSEQAFVKANAGTARSFTKMSGQTRGAMQNMSYQLQDIFVQISSGQGATRALSQQLPQLASGFGAVGAAVGLAAAVLIPLAGSLLDFESGSDAVKGSTEELSKALDAYRAAAKAANLTTAEGIALYGEMAGAMGKVIDSNLEFAKGDAERALAANKDLLIAKTEAMIAQQQRLAEAERAAADPNNMIDMIPAIDAATVAIEEQMQQLGLTREEYAKYTDLVTSARSAKGAEQEAAAWADVSTFIAQNVDGVGDLADEHRAIGQALNDNLEIQAQISAVTDDTATYAERYSQTIAAINYSNAIAGAQQLRDITAGILSDAIGIMNTLGGGGPIGSLSDLGTGMWNAAQDRLQSIESNGLGDRPTARPFSVSETAIYGPEAKKSGGKGGGSKAKATKEAFDYLEALDAEIEALQREQMLLSMTSEQIAVQEAKWKALDAAKKAGITVTGAMTAKIEEQAAQVGKLTGELERAEIAQQQFDDAIDGIADAMAGALVAGESLREGLAQVLKQIASDILNSGIKNAIAGQFGGGGGFLGGILGIFGGGDPLSSALRGAGLSPSFDGGGFTGMGSRSGGIDGKGGFPAILHPNETVVDHTRGQSAGGVGDINVTVSVDDEGALRAYVDKHVTSVASRTVAAYDKAMPSRVQQINAHPRKR